MRAAAIYRALLHCYPSAFRDEYGSQMLLMFAEQLSEAHRTGNRLQQIAVWAQAATDAMTVAPREHWHVILQDLRYACRTMASSPGFTAVAILSLAFGIGANTAIFSLWNGVLRASLPGVGEPEQLVMLSDPDATGMWSGRWEGRTDGPRSWLTYGEFEQLRDNAGSFSELMASQSSLNSWQATIDGGALEDARGRLVSGGFFQVLRVRPAIGRLFTVADDDVEAPHAVISYSYWQRRFGGRPDVLGRTITLRKVALTIIGVAPSVFIGETSGQRPDLWLPLRLQPRVIPRADWLHDTPPDKVMWLQVFGRLKPGVSYGQAEAEANALFQSGLKSFYGAAASGDRRAEFLDQHLRLQSGARGASSTRHRFSQSLGALLAAVGVLLLIACANLANLLLARGAARTPEIALRLSLGASRARIIRQLVTESVTLAIAGGLAAIAVAYALHGALVRMIAAADPRFHLVFSLEPIVSGFAVAATVGAVLLFGLLPAWQISGSDVGAGLRGQSRGGIGTLGQLRSRRFVVSLQLALSLPLLVGAGLLARTAYNLQHADLGFPADRLLLVRVDLRETASDAARRDALRRELVVQLQQLPSVRSASFSQLGIFTGGNSSSTIEVEGYTPRGDNDRGSGQDTVGPRYFTTLGIPIILGRDVTERDRGESPKVCVINEAFANLFFARRNPLGLRITELDDDDSRTHYQVVGVARNARTQDLRDAVVPRFFVAAGQPPAAADSPTFLIRTATGASPRIEDVRKAFQRVDAGLPIMSAKTLDEQLAPLTAQDRTTAQLCLVFACVALILAAVGLYGVLSYGVARRTGEIAIRIALGARPARVITMILRETGGLVAVGLILGGALAYVTSRVIESRLYGVAPRDPITLASATGLLFLVALGATFLPARRASRVDPMIALRQG